MPLDPSAPRADGPGNALPVIDRLVRLLAGPFERQTTLLAVCPNSEAVVRAALDAAREADAPILFAATLNQVDRDGGYTGWTPRGLAAFLRAEADRIGLSAPVLPCLDHGGPWLKDADARDRLPYEAAMQAVKASIEACLDAGYALLHIDPTVDRTLPPGTPVPVQLVVARTLELIEHAETYRRAAGYPPVSYEVGTEEVHGGLADLDHVDAFLAALAGGLRARGLERAWPAFVVGKVGTDLDTTTFDAPTARRLTACVRAYGSLVKGHYTDDVENPADYPLSGMGGANIGPALAAVEFDALAVLERLAGNLGRELAFRNALGRALVASGRWKKWLRPAEAAADFDALPEERQAWLLRTGSRYVWTQPDVAAARAELYASVRDHADGPAYVHWRIKTRILSYVHAFNLVGFAEKARTAAGSL